MPVEIPQRIKDAQDEYSERYGTRVQARKLTEEQVRQIMVDPRDDTQLGAALGVHSSAVTRVRLGYSWRHITGITGRGAVHRRTPMGENHHFAKLTANQAREIYLIDNVPLDELAHRYGISVNTIRAIRRGRRWRSVTIGLPRPIGLAVRRGQKPTRNLGI